MAVRLGDMKAVRRNMKKKNSESTPWEVYDLATDPGETTDLAPQHPDIVTEAVEVLLQQISPNSVFPMPKPQEG
jgi:arylsulfatase